MAKQIPTNDHKFLFYLSFFFGRQPSSDRRPCLLKVFFFFAHKDAVLVPRLLGLVRRPLGRRPRSIKVGINEGPAFWTKVLDLL